MVSSFKPLENKRNNGCEVSSAVIPLMQNEHLYHLSIRSSKLLGPRRYMMSNSWHLAGLKGDLIALQDHYNCTIAKPKINIYFLEYLQQFLVNFSPGR